MYIDNFFLKMRLILNPEYFYVFLYHQFSLYWFWWLVKNYLSPVTNRWTQSFIKAEFKFINHCHKWIGVKYCSSLNIHFVFQIIVLIMKLSSVSHIDDTGIPKKDALWLTVCEWALITSSVSNGRTLSRRPASLPAERYMFETQHRRLLGEARWAAMLPCTFRILLEDSSQSVHRESIFFVCSDRTDVSLRDYRFFKP